MGSRKAEAKEAARSGEIALEAWGGVRAIGG